LGLTILLITHDLGVVARVADRVSVMYAGQVVESAPVRNLFRSPQHPYTVGLLSCVPVPGGARRDRPLGHIPGVVPAIGRGFAGCAFRSRCAYAEPECAAAISHRSLSATHRYLCRLAPGARVQSGAT
jgi:peptide/nickel transport system ATP-binding protein